MNKADAEKILKFYNRIDDDIRMCKASKKECEEIYNTIGAMNYDGMPKATGRSDKVAKTAIKAAERENRKNIEFFNKRITELNRIKTEILKELTTMQAVHKVILTGFYTKGFKWEQIAEQVGYSVRQAQNHRTEALEIMAKKLSRNRYILRSEVIKGILK